MSVQRFFIDGTEQSNETRVVRSTLLVDLWDAGLADLISARRNSKPFEVQTLGALLGNLLADENIPVEIKNNLDRYSLERFIRDMAANGYNLSFTDELPYGKREQAPAVNVGAIVPAVGSFQLTVTFATNQDIRRLYVHLTVNNGNIVERSVRVTPDAGTGVAIASFNVPSRVYSTGYCAGIDSNGLRGFKSADFPTFTVL